MITPLSGERLVQKAADIAEQWHDGQAHGFGEDSYFNMHLVPIAGIVRRLGYGAIYVACGLLHDIKEDTSITDDQLEDEGMPLNLIYSTNLLAKTGELHRIYLNKILSDKVATVGKFADSSFNFAWTILNSPTVPDSKFNSRALEYSHNITVLRPALPEPEDS